MTIRQRLSLQFTLIVALILGGVLAIVYYITAITTEQTFAQRLEDRAYVAANKFLEQDEASSEVFSGFERKYLQALPEELIQVFDEGNRNTFIRKDSTVTYPPELIDRIRSQSPLLFQWGGRPGLGIYYRDNQGNFVIIVSAADEYGQKRLSSLLWLMTFSYLTSIAVIYGAGRIFSARALAPMRTIVHDVQTITASNLHRRLEPENTVDEIGELAMTFNGMLARLEHAFASQRMFISNASHELRTPITTIIGRIEVMLSRKRSVTEFRSALEEIHGESEAMKELLTMLLNLAQAESAERSDLLDDVRIDELLWEVTDGSRKRTADVAVHLVFGAMPNDTAEMIVKGNKYLLFSAFSNLIGNAVKFGGGHPVTCTMQLREDAIVVEVQDRGLGIAAEDLAYIFQPFYRAQQARSFDGHGIGLALTDRIVRLHGGSIAVHSVPGTGSTFTVTLPHAPSL